MQRVLLNVKKSSRLPKQANSRLYDRRYGLSGRDVMGGAGTNVPVAKSSKELKKFLAGCTKKLPPKELVDIELN